MSARELLSCLKTAMPSEQSNANIRLERAQQTSKTWNGGA